VGIAELEVRVAQQQEQIEQLLARNCDLEAQLAQARNLQVPKRALKSFACGPKNVVN
jgi:hypothetical protein